MMNKALDGAATLTAMVIRLESERDAAIARAERAEAALAAMSLDALRGEDVGNALASANAAIARAERAEAALRTTLDSKEFFRICWEEAEAALAQYRAELADRLYEPCVWKYTEIEKEPWGVLEAYYHTTCNHIEHGMSDLPYCPHCGHPIQIAPSDNDLLSPDQEGA